MIGRAWPSQPNSWSHVAIGTKSMVAPSQGSQTLGCAPCSAMANKPFVRVWPNPWSHAAKATKPLAVLGHGTWPSEPNTWPHMAKATLFFLKQYLYYFINSIVFFYG